MFRRLGLIVALGLLAACRAAPVSPGAATGTAPSTSTPPPPSPTPTTPPSPKPMPTTPISPTATAFDSPIATPAPPTTDEPWVEPSPRPLSRTNASIEAPRRVPNARRNFWIVDGTTGQRQKITARLRTQTPHVAMWVEEGVWHDVRLLEEAAQIFEAGICPRIRAAFGSEWTPGIDQDPRISILHTTGLGENVLGYTSSLDEYSSDLYPLSNETEMITINIELADIGSPRYNGLLAREFLRLVQWHQDRNEERWLREGLAELAAVLSGSPTDTLHQAYVEQADTPLTAWTDTDSQRAAAYLFVNYFHQRFGDDATRSLTAEPANGVKGFEAVLEKLGTELTFDDLFADWLVANYLDSVSGTNNTRYTYSGLDLAQPAASAIYDTYPVDAETSVHQFGADYIVLRGEDDVRVQFTGQTETPLLGRMPRVEQQVWWSNRADESLTVLTGRFDVHEAQQATLTYQAWYDIEPHYDYATVEISADGGAHWQILRTPSGTDANPHGSNPGWGYTGRSGDWIREEIDVSEYVGGDILVRFSYLTDGAVTGEGLLLDNVSIVEIDDQEKSAAETGTWRAQGFVLTDGVVSQDYLALLINVGEQITVESLPLEKDQSAEWIVPLGSGDLREAVLVLSATAPLGRQAATYQLTISQ